MQLTLLNVTWDLDDPTQGNVPPVAIFVPEGLEDTLLHRCRYPSDTDVVAEWLSDKYGWCVNTWEYSDG